MTARIGWRRTGAAGTTSPEHGKADVAPCSTIIDGTARAAATNGVTTTAGAIATETEIVIATAIGTVDSSPW